MSAQPPYSVQQTGVLSGPFLFDTNQPTINSPISSGYWPDGTMRVNNAVTQSFIVSLCGGILTLQHAGGADCRQVALTPVYDTVNSTTTTVTSGAAASTRTHGPAGTLVSSGSTITNHVLDPYVTVTSLYTRPTTNLITSVAPSLTGHTRPLLLQIPTTYVTIAALYTGYVLSTGTSLFPTVVGQPGTVVVREPRPTCISAGLAHTGYPNNYTGGGTNDNM